MSHKNTAPSPVAPLRGDSPTTELEWDCPGRGVWLAYKDRQFCGMIQNDDAAQKDVTARFEVIDAHYHRVGFYNEFSAAEGALNRSRATGYSFDRVRLITLLSLAVAAGTVAAAAISVFVQ